MNKVVMYTDGSCPKPNGPGGYCAILTYGKHERVIAGHLESTTNNLAELTAVLKGLEAIKKHGASVHIVSDSKLIIGWLSQGWKRIDVECHELSDDIDIVVALKELDLTFEHVDGHAGHEYNERADVIAGLCTKNEWHGE